MTSLYMTPVIPYAGSSQADLIKRARHDYHLIQKRTPRRVAYVRSKYFSKDKIFVNTFWVHVNQKTSRDRVRRLKLFACAIDVIRNTPFGPLSTQSTTSADELLHRFAAVTPGGLHFVVQIKEQKKSGRKDFISVFPIK